jgi:hypothetical protein
MTPRARERQTDSTLRAAHHLTLTAAAASSRSRARARPLLQSKKTRFIIYLTKRSVAFS